MFRIACSRLGYQGGQRIVPAAAAAAGAARYGKAGVSLGRVSSSSLLVRTFAAPPTAWNTKIVCTLGPASSNEEVLEQMILAGMDVCRLNFSHGKYESHKETFNTVRRLGEKYGHQVAVLCDIQGPKIRTGKMEKPFEVSVGDTIRVTPSSCEGNPDRIQISYETLGKCGVNALHAVVFILARPEYVLLLSIIISKTQYSSSFFTCM